MQMHQRATFVQGDFTRWYIQYIIDLMGHFVSNTCLLMYRASYFNLAKSIFGHSIFVLRSS